MTKKPPIRNRVRELREKHGQISQAALGKEIGVTRQTIIELFTSSGHRITAGQSRIFESEDHQKMLEVVRNIAELTGANPDQSVADASALQYVVKAGRA